MCDWVSDRAPDIDNANPRFEKAISFLGEMITDSREACFVGLVNVDSFL